MFSVFLICEIIAMDSHSIHHDVSEEKSCKGPADPSAEEIRLVSGGDSAKETNITTPALVSSDIVESPGGSSGPEGKAIPSPHVGGHMVGFSVPQASGCVEGQRERQEGVIGGGRENKSRWISDSKIAETSIAVIVQSTAIVIPLHFSAVLSSENRYLLMCIMVANLVGFLFCMAAIIQSHNRPRVAGIFARIGCVATVVGFIIMVALTLPDDHVWKIAMTCLVLFVAFVFSFL